MYQYKIYASDKDFLGLVFFGTDKNNTGEDFKHIFSVQVFYESVIHKRKKIDLLL